MAWIAGVQPDYALGRAEGPAQGRQSQIASVKRLIEPPRDLVAQGFKLRRSMGRARDANADRSGSGGNPPIFQPTSARMAACVTKGLWAIRDVVDVFEAWKTT